MAGERVGGMRHFLLPRADSGADLGDVHLRLWSAVLSARHVAIVALAAAAAATPAVGPNRGWIALAIVGVVLPYNVALDVHLRRRGRLHPAMPYVDLILAAAFPLAEPTTWTPALMVGVADVALDAIAFDRKVALVAGLGGTAGFALVAAVAEPTDAVIGLVAFPIAAAMMVSTVGSVADQERRSRRRYEGLVAGLDAIVWEADPATLAFTYVSRPAERILGYPVQRWLDDPRFWASMIHPEDRPRTVEGCRVAVAEGRDHELVYRAVTADGREVWLRDLVHVEVGADGRAAAMSGVMVDVTAEKHAEGALRHLALHDVLTGLPNRALLTDRLERAVAEATRTRWPLALLVMDLDDFKEVNDTLGHHVGDELLQHVARRLDGLLRESDTVARLGGDEFAVLLTTDAGPDGAERVAQRVRHSLGEPFEVGGVLLQTQASIGIALHPGDALDAAELVQRADVAMYRAKRGGTGHAYYGAPSEPGAPRRLDLAPDLRQAIAGDQLVLHYQPIVSLPSGVTVGVEALVRWRHPDHGLLAPAEFLDMADVAGLADDMTAWVIDRAASQGRRWADTGADVWMSVNVGVRTLRAPPFADRLAKILDDAGLPPERLVLEIAERDLMDDIASTIPVLEALAATGVRLAIDDFGTGHSSLAHLRRLPVGQIKIDGTLLAGMAHDADGHGDGVVVRAIVELAHTLGLEVVAEGVDRPDVLAALGELGCDLAQGYALARPALAEEVDVAAARRRGGQ